jgi:hypothetical protein
LSLKRVINATMLMRWLAYVLGIMLPAMLMFGIVVGAVGGVELLIAAKPPAPAPTKNTPLMPAPA